MCSISQTAAELGFDLLGDDSDGEFTCCDDALCNGPSGNGNGGDGGNGNGNGGGGGAASVMISTAGMLVAITAALLEYVI